MSPACVFKSAAVTGAGFAWGMGTKLGLDGRIVVVAGFADAGVGGGATGTGFSGVGIEFPGRACAGARFAAAKGRLAATAEAAVLGGAIAGLAGVTGFAAGTAATGFMVSAAAGAIFSGMFAAVAGLAGGMKAGEGCTDAVAGVVATNGAVATSEVSFAAQLATDSSDNVEQKEANISLVIILKNLPDAC